MDFVKNLGLQNIRDLIKIIEVSDLLFGRNCVFADPVSVERSKQVSWVGRSSEGTNG